MCFFCFLFSYFTKKGKTVMEKKNGKTAIFKWDGHEEKVTLRVGSYENGRIYVELVSLQDGTEEHLDDLTVNLPLFLLRKNAAYISTDFCREKLAFIEQNDLGSVMPYTVPYHSGSVWWVVFDLKRLAEYDPVGVRKYQQRSKQ